MFAVLVVNTVVCKTLNGKQRFLVSKVKRLDLDADDDNDDDDESGGGNDYENNDDGYNDRKKNGTRRRRARGSKRVELEKEHWMFLNGVAVGSVLFPIRFPIFILAFLPFQLDHSLVLFRHDPVASNGLSDLNMTFDRKKP